MSAETPASQSREFRKPGLASAISLSLSCMVGSGWLFAAYYAAQYAGPAACLSWIIAAALVLILSLLLAETATMYSLRGFFARLLSISHNNPDLGYIIAISGWLAMVVIIPSEAAATIQYLATLFPALTPRLFVNEALTPTGIGGVVLLMLLYTLANYWGIKGLARANNIVTLIKLVIPALTAAILMAAAFHGNNFTVHGFAPYGLDRSFSAVVVTGIFYAYYGFSMVAIFSTELREPHKNIPRALIISLVLCLGIYLLLQIAFIAALPPDMVGRGWASLNFTSPLAELLLLFQVNILHAWAMVLYADAALSPSGAGLVYMGSATRIITGMAQDSQLPRFFEHLHPLHHLSRRSLLATLLICCVMVIFFKSWRELVIVVTVFQLITCVAIPFAFARLRLKAADKPRSFRVKGGQVLSYIAFIAVSYLLTQATSTAVGLSIILQLVCLLCYLGTYYRGPLAMIYGLASCWTLCFYLLLAFCFAWLNDSGYLHSTLGISAFITLFTLSYILVIQQKNHHGQATAQTDQLFKTD